MTRKHKVLMVEDNAIIAKVAVIRLTALGIDTDIAENGLLALKLFEENTYSLVFMDIAMPVMDGLSATEAMRHIEKSSQRAKTPIIGITASANKEECLLAGMDDFVVKPPDYERVLQKWLPEIFQTKWSQSG